MSRRAQLRLNTQTTPATKKHLLLLLLLLNMPCPSARPATTTERKAGEAEHESGKGAAERRPN
jgi:hypothetical protein